MLEGSKELSKHAVYVGVPEKTSPRPGEPISNAQLAFIHTHGVRAWKMRTAMNVAMKGSGKLSYSAALALYIHTFGSPLYQVPPRPIVEPAIKANMKKLEGEFKLAAKAGLAGNKAQVQTHLRRAGMMAQNFVRAWFTDPRNHWAKNAPSTIRPKKSSRPLIDTGDLRKSMTYIVT